MASDELRPGLHAMWSAVAGGWQEHADYVDSRSSALTERMLEVAAGMPGDRVLELACGPGGAGLAAAARVAPGGEVVLSDVAPEMTAVAAARAESLGLDNVTTRELDLEEIQEPDESFDVVLCREGLMFAADPARAAREIHRVLRRGGRLAASVWGPRERNPWLGGVLDAVSAQVGAPVPPPGIPGPFALSDSARLRSIIEEAGLAGVVVTEEPAPMRTSSFEEWWTRTTALAGPLAKRIVLMPAEDREELAHRAREVARPYETPGGSSSLA